MFFRDPQRYPADALVDRLLEVLTIRSNAIVVAPPGTGKTTRLPLALLDSLGALGSGARILVTEPRRLAARAAAERMASTLGEPVGHTVGYRTRDDTKISAHTKIEVMTEGVFLRILQDDPGLTDVAAVFLDEVHERHLDTDLSLTLIRHAQELLRPDLRLIILSATLDDQRLSAMFDAEILRIDSRVFPVAIEWKPALQRTLTMDAARAVEEEFLNGGNAEGNGDILVFAPGNREIREILRFLERKAFGAHVTLRSLSGSQTAAEQRLAFSSTPSGQRVVTVATSIAQTSITLPGIRTVIDLGLSRVPRYDLRSGLSRLVTERCAQATAVQRSGRAGRLGPGRSVRLWSEQEFSRSAPFELPEIMLTDLAATVLRLAVWGVRNPNDLTWLDDPPDAAWELAVALLRDLELLDASGHATDAGVSAERSGVEPRLASLVLRAATMSGATAERAIALASVLSDSTDTATKKEPLRGRVESLLAEMRGPDLARGTHPNLTRGIQRTQAQLREIVRAQIVNETKDNPSNAVSATDNNSPVHDVSMGGLLSLAYPERIAVRSTTTVDRYQLASGGIATLQHEEPSMGSTFIVAAELDGDRKAGRIYSALLLEEHTLRELHGNRIQTERIVSTETGPNGIAKVACIERLGAAILSSTDVEPTADEKIRARIDHFDDLALQKLFTERSVEELLARLTVVHRSSPFSATPTPTELLARKSSWLPAIIDGRRPADALLEFFELERFDVRRELKSLAPQDFALPSGRTLSIDYLNEAGPAVRSRLQDFFSLRSHPTIGNGTTPLLVEMLTPAGRPTATTKDLPQFWNGGYRQVRAELRGRYPKHAWPEHPHEPKR